MSDSNDTKDLRQKWEQFRPTKVLWFWSCVGAIVVALILGFTVGGWVTGGTAREMAQAAREDGRAQLAAAICVDSFVASPKFAANLAALKKEDSWAQDSFISDAGWVTLAGMDEPVDGAAEICAEKLIEMKAKAKDAGKDAAAGGKMKES